MARSEEAIRRAKRNYRERNREKIREKALVYDRARRRAKGMAIRGSAEWLAKRGPDHYLSGEKHGMWKGEAASYSAHHHWIKRWGERKNVCSQCGGVNREGGFRKVRTDWANISGRYLRELSDWIELCSACHKRFDLARGGDA